MAMPASTRSQGESGPRLKDSLSCVMLDAGRVEIRTSSIFYNIKPVQRG